MDKGNGLQRGSGGDATGVMGWGVVGAGLLYVGLAVVLTWPLSLGFCSRIPGGCTDVWQNYWGFWWWHHAIFDLGQSPLWTKMLYHPFGAVLRCTRIRLSTCYGRCRCNGCGVLLPR